MQLNKNKILILCDGSAKYGYGHIKRSRALLESLIKRNFNVQLKVISKIKELNTYLVLNRVFKEGTVIFDLPYNVDNLISMFIEAGFLTIALDYFGNISPHVNIAVFEHKTIKAVYQSYVGFEYVIIRSEIVNIKNKNINQNFEDYVLVVIGGSDINNEGINTAKLVAKAGFNVKLVSGPYSNYKNNLRYYTLYKEPVNLPELFCNASWVISNGGGSLFESLFLKKEVFVLPQTKLEENISKYFLEKKMVLGVGFSNLEYFLKTKKITKVSKTKNIIDGLGLDRIVDLIYQHQLKH
jgi:spore coat polysaccharide biosynthesis predicted glycosyltransferase SpsG